jgi:hypothetical protein
VLATRLAIQVPNVVVERVPVHMMDVIPPWNRAMHRLPNLSVKMLHPLDNVPPRWTIVFTIRPIARVGIPTKLDAIEDNRVNSGRHKSSSTRIISPYSNASIGAQAPFAHMR